MLEALLETGEIDFVAMDVKAPLDFFSYRRSAGRSIDLTLIQRSIELLKMEKTAYEFRMTVVPGLHREEDIWNLAWQLRAGQRLVLQNFNAENPLDPLLKNTVPYDPEVLKRMEKEIQGLA
jgi:pyruvate formate lyase activating enzyme